MYCTQNEKMFSVQPLLYAILASSLLSVHVLMDAVGMDLLSSYDDGAAPIGANSF